MSAHFVSFRFERCSVVLVQCGLFDDEKPNKPHRSLVSEVTCQWSHLSVESLVSGVTCRLRHLHLRPKLSLVRGRSSLILPGVFWRRDNGQKDADDRVA